MHMSSNAGPSLLDEVRTLRARLTNADDRLRDYEEDMSALEERNRLHFTATEAAAAADEARLQHQERRMEAYADQLRRDSLAW